MSQKKSRRGEVRACGRVWYPWSDGVATVVNDRFEVVTWKFGSIHQSKVFIHYSKSKDPMDGPSIGMCLAPGKTREEAMRRGLDWVAQYKGPDTPDELFPKLFRRWKTIYRRRADIIDHLFFVIGNGYSWVDGGIVCTSDDGDEEERPVKVPPPGSPEAYSDAFYDLPYPEQKVIQDYHYHLREEAMAVGPIYDDGRAREFYPVCHYSAILLVPDDVRPEWLMVAYEAALMLRDRQARIPMRPEDQPRCDLNIKYGEKVVADLEAKYPHLKDLFQIPPTDHKAREELVMKTRQETEIARANIKAHVAEFLARKKASGEEKTDA